MFLYQVHRNSRTETMPVNGLLLTLTEDETLAQGSLLEIEGRNDIELGDRTDRWQPVVVETGGTRESHEVHEWLEKLPGVLSVDVVFSSVSPPPAKSHKSSDKPSDETPADGSSSKKALK